MSKLCYCTNSKSSFWQVRKHSKTVVQFTSNLSKWKMPHTMQLFNKTKKYVSSNSESVQCNFFIFDHVTFIQFKICCCVQNFIKIWWYIDFQNGGRPPSWNCVTTIRDHPRSLCCWLQLPVKFHVNVIHRYEDIAIWIFRTFGLKCLSRPPKWGFWTQKCNYSSSRPPKSTSLHKCASFKLSTVKIRWGVWPVGESTESVDTHTYTQVNLYSVHAYHWTDNNNQSWYHKKLTTQDDGSRTWYRYTKSRIYVM